MLSAPPVIPATRQPIFTGALTPARAARPDLLRNQLGEPGPLRQRHDRDQPGPRHEIRVIKRCVNPGQAMQQSHVTGVLSNQATELKTLLSFQFRGHLSR